MRGEGVDERDLRLALRRIRDDGFWENEALWAEVAETLPAYRLSKFQPLMPQWVAREMVGRYLLDVAGARRWMEKITPG